MNSSRDKIILALSLIIGILIAVTSFFGAFSGNFYFKETENWQAQSVGQDYINLFVVIFLVVTALMVYNKNTYGILLWAGAILYLIYTYLIYCFDIHFNIFFVAYCMILGLCFYSLLYFFYSQIGIVTLEIRNYKIVKVTAFYFLTISILFYCLWLMEIVPSIINNRTPDSLTEAGLVTNPVHVIDLSVVLPGIFITGLLLLKENKLGFLLAPIILTFFILMDITIGALTIVMAQRGIETNKAVTVIMAVLAMFSAVILILNARNVKLLLR